MPVYPPAHIRLQFLGTLQQAPGGGSDIFEFGFADHSGQTPEEVATAALPVVTAFYGSGTDQCSSFSKLTGVRAESVAADGKVSDSYYLAVNPPRQGSATGNVCTLLCQAITLETNNEGKGGRMVQGRFFPPAYGAIEGSTTDLEDAQTLANSYRDFLNNLKLAGLVPAVASITQGGQIAPVTAVSVSTGVDTQRRRKNHVTLQRSSKVTL